jgi:16S rRNA (guanine(966)-N(2))-methyltransferase RsmD
MRIVAGKWRGKQIVAPKNLPVRPTTDMAKESLFNLIRNYLDFEHIRALDLFSGTGNLSYELASRGCPSITSVDSSRDCIRFIHKTATALPTDAIAPVASEAITYVKRSPSQWDLILADPPFDFERYEELIDAILTGQRLTKTGVFVLEHGPFTSFVDHPHCFDHRKYGNVQLSFFQPDPLEQEDSEK